MKQFVRKLNDFSKYDKERIYYKRLITGENKGGEKDYSGYYCYECGNKLIFIADSNENYRCEPYRIHKEFIKSQTVKIDGETKREISYFKALCCKCVNMKFRNKDCDCLSYLEQEIKKIQEAVSKTETDLSENKKLLDYLKKGKSEFKEIWRYIEEVEKKINSLENHKLNNQRYIKDLELKKNLVECQLKGLEI